MQYICVPGSMICPLSTLNNHCPLTPVLPVSATSRTELVREVGSVRFLYMYAEERET